MSEKKITGETPAAGARPYGLGRDLKRFGRAVRTYLRERRELAAIRGRHDTAGSPPDRGGDGSDVAPNVHVSSVQVSQSRLREHLHTIIGERHHLTSPEHHAATADFIRRTLEGSGWEVRDQAVEGPHGIGANIIARRQGMQRPERLWLLGAHYDTVIGTPGADDNGIAVAGLLEAADKLSGFVFRDTVELCAWDMEESQSRSAGSLIGSTTMARDARRRGVDIAGVLDLEMIGLCQPEPDTQKMPRGFGLLFPKQIKRMKDRGMRGDFLVGVGNRPAEGLLEVFADCAARVDLPFLPLSVTGAARLVRDLYRSDHAPFWMRGYPAVMLTDTAYFRNGHYHQPTDTIDTIDFDFAARVTAASILTVARLAGASRHSSV